MYLIPKQHSFCIIFIIVNEPFGKNTLSYFPAQYRRDVPINSLGIVEGRLLFLSGPNNFSPIFSYCSPYFLVLYRVLSFCTLPQLLVV